MKNLLCSVLQAALALTSTVAASTVSVDANYDNLTTSEAGVPAAVGTYDYLAYNSYSVLGDSLGLVGGVAPHSEPNYVGPDPDPTDGTPNITVVSPFKTFSPKSFWFGCDADLDEGAVNVATQCTIVVTAFKQPGGPEVAVADFTFTPPPDVVTQAPMVQAVLSDGFENVYAVVIVQTGPSTNVLGIDDFQYTVST